MLFRQDTLAEVRRKIYYLLRRDKFLSGLVLASPTPTSTAVALTAAKPWPDDNFQGCMAYAVAGTGLGQSAFVSASARGTGVLTLEPATSPVFDATTRLEILPDQLTPDAVNAMINLALDDLEQSINVYVESPNPTIDSTRLLITIPTTFNKLVDVTYLDTGGIWWKYRHRLDPESPGYDGAKDFYVRGRTIYLSEPISTDIVGANIYVNGYRLPVQVVADSDLCEAPSAYLVYHAAANLDQALAGNVDVDPEGHGTRASAWLAQAQQNRPLGNYTNWKPNTFSLEPA